MLLHYCLPSGFKTLFKKRIFSWILESQTWCCCCYLILAVFHLSIGRQSVTGQKDEMLHKQIVFHLEAAELKVMDGRIFTTNPPCEMSNKDNTPNEHTFIQVFFFFW